MYTSNKRSLNSDTPLLVLPRFPTSYPQVGDNLFVHAGLLPEHIRGTAAGEGGRGQGSTVAEAEEVMEKLNADTCAWLLGQRAIPEEIWQSDSPLWTRVYSDPDSRDIDAAARMQLEEVRAARCLRCALRVA